MPPNETSGSLTYFENIAAFLDESFHRLALVAGKPEFEAFADLFEALDVALGLFEVLFKSGFQVRVRRGLTPPMLHAPSLRWRRWV